MNKTAVLLCVVAMMAVSAYASILSEGQYQFLFTHFTDQYEKTYETNQFLYRYNVFKDNLNYILDANAQDQGFQLGLNEFADLTNEEYRQQFLSGLMQVNPNESPFAGDDLYAGEFSATGSLNIPASLDYRSKGVVAPVRNQGSCGSCYSFAAISALESVYARKTGKLVLLSDQQAVDCCKTTNGCNGGLPSLVYQYGKSGICTRAAYPYTGKKQGCKSCSAAVKVSSYQSIAGNDKAHKEALANRGPLAIAVDASSSNFQFYKSGILTSCPMKGYNHAVNLVGYGSNYFILRNSWGTSWGESGYMRVAGGACGTARSNLDVVPIV